MPADSLTCPTCGRAAEAGARFCPADGTPLVASRPASDALADLLADPAPARAAHARAAPARVAPARAAPARAAPARAAEPSAAVASPPLAPPAPPRGRGALVAVVIVGLLAAAALTAYLVMGGSGLEQEAYDAIDRGDLVTPERASAYDLAQRIARDDPDSAALDRIGARAIGPLVEQADAFYARFYTTSEATDADWDRVARAMVWAEQVAPENAHVRARREYADARVAFRLGDTDAARDGYQRAAEAWPEWALPPNSLGRALADAGDERGAEAQYRLAARLDPAWPFPFSNLGALLLRRNRPNDAAEALAAAVRADPSRAYSHALLARALAAADRYAEAAASATEALRLDPTGDAGFDANRLRSDAGQWELLAQGVVDWDGDGAVEPDPEYDYEDYYGD